MAKINFKNLKVKPGIAGDTTITVDVTKEFSDIIYNGMTGIEAHDLAFKIFRAEGAVELSESEVAIVHEAMNRYCTPKFIDAVQTALNEKDNG